MGAIEYYTYDDYCQWKGNWELIWGYPLAMAPSPMISHQMISAQILIELSISMDECKECIVISEQDWKISNDTVVKPDVVMICNEPNDAHITKPPKIVVEVISKSTAKRDETTKFELYQKERVPYYIIVYPDDLIAKVYKLDFKEYDRQGDFTKETYNFKDTLCNIKINFEKVFRRFRK